GGRGAMPSEFCSSVMKSFRLMLGIAFKTREVILIAAPDGVARHEPVHSLADEARHRVVAAHPHNCFWGALRRRRFDAIQFPAFQTNHAVTIPESPLEQSSRFQRGYHNRVRDFALAQISRDMHFLRDREVRSA